MYKHQLRDSFLSILLFIMSLIHTYNSTQNMPSSPRRCHGSLSRCASSSSSSTGTGHSNYRKASPFRDKHIQVSVWERAPNVEFDQNAGSGCIDFRTSESKIFLPPELSSFELQYDNVFNKLSSLRDIYPSMTKSVLRKVLEGGHGVVLRYGHNESENSFTVCEGPGACQCGMAVRAMKDILDHEERVEVSFVQVHTEFVYDLLSSESDTIFKASRKQRSNFHPIGAGTEMAVVQPNFKHVEVHDMNTFLSLLKSAQKSRDAYATFDQTPLIRTHQILKISLLKTRRRNVPSNIWFVDLAGVEQISGGEDWAMDDVLSLRVLEACLKAKEEKLPPPGALHESQLTTLLAPCFEEAGYVSLLIRVGGSALEEETLRALYLGQQGRELVAPIENLNKQEVLLSSARTSTTSSACEINVGVSKGENKNNSDLLEGHYARDLAVETEKHAKEIEYLKLTLANSKEKHKNRKNQVKVLEHQHKVLQEEATNYWKFLEDEKTAHEEALVFAQHSILTAINERKQVEARMVLLEEELKQHRETLPFLKASRAKYKKRFEQAEAECLALHKLVASDNNENHPSTITTRHTEDDSWNRHLEKIEWLSLD